MSLSMVFVVMHVQANVLYGSRGFYKNKDKFGWVKYWQMIYNLPKFSPPEFCTIWYCIVQNVTKAGK